MNNVNFDLKPPQAVEPVDESKYRESYEKATVLEVQNIAPQKPIILEPVSIINWEMIATEIYGPWWQHCLVCMHTDNGVHSGMAQQSGKTRISSVCQASAPA